MRHVPARRTHAEAPVEPHTAAGAGSGHTPRGFSTQSTSSRVVIVSAAWKTMLAVSESRTSDGAGKPEDRPGPPAAPGASQIRYQSVIEFLKDGKK